LEHYAIGCHRRVAANPYWWEARGEDYQIIVHKLKGTTTCDKHRLTGKANGYKW